MQRCYSKKTRIEQTTSKKRNSIRRKKREEDLNKRKQWSVYDYGTLLKEVKLKARNTKVLYARPTNRVTGSYEWRRSLTQEPFLPRWRTPLEAWERWVWQRVGSCKRQCSEAHGAPLMRPGVWNCWTQEKSKDCPCYFRSKGSTMAGGTRSRGPTLAQD